MGSHRSALRFSRSEAPWSPSKRLHQVAPRFTENGDTIGRQRMWTAQDQARNPRSVTSDRDYRQLEGRCDRTKG
jgi:hypothetical protein